MKAQSKVKPAALKKRPKPDSEDEESTPENDPKLDDSVLSTTPPSAKKQKKAHVPSKSGAKPLKENDNEACNVDGADDPKLKKGSKSTDQYQKVSVLVFSVY